MSVRATTNRSSDIDAAAPTPPKRRRARAAARGVEDRRVSIKENPTPRRRRARVAVDDAPTEVTMEAEVDSGPTNDGAYDGDAAGGDGNDEDSGAMDGGDGDGEDFGTTNDGVYDGDANGEEGEEGDEDFETTNDADGNDGDAVGNDGEEDDEYEDEMIRQSVQIEPENGGEIETDAYQTFANEYHAPPVGVVAEEDFAAEEALTEEILDPLVPPSLRRPASFRPASPRPASYAGGQRRRVSAKAPSRQKEDPKRHSAKFVYGEDLAIATMRLVSHLASIREAGGPIPSCTVAKVRELDSRLRAARDSATAIGNSCSQQTIVDAVSIQMRKYYTDLISSLESATYGEPLPTILSVTDRLSLTDIEGYYAEDSKWLLERQARIFNTVDPLPRNVGDDLGEMFIRTSPLDSRRTDYLVCSGAGGGGEMPWVGAKVFLTTKYGTTVAEMVPTPPQISHPMFPLAYPYYAMFAYDLPTVTLSREKDLPKTTIVIKDMPALRAEKAKATVCVDLPDPGAPPRIPTITERLTMARMAKRRIALEQRALAEAEAKCALPSKWCVPTGWIREEIGSLVIFSKAVNLQKRFAYALNTTSPRILILSNDFNMFPEFARFFFVQNWKRIASGANAVLGPSKPKDAGKKKIKWSCVGLVTQPRTILKGEKFPVGFPRGGVLRVIKFADAMASSCAGDCADGEDSEARQSAGHILADAVKTPNAFLRQHAMRDLAVAVDGFADIIATKQVARILSLASKSTHTAISSTLSGVIWAVGAIETVGAGLGDAVVSPVETRIVLSFSQLTESIWRAWSGAIAQAGFLAPRLVGDSEAVEFALPTALINPKTKVTEYTKRYYAFGVLILANALKATKTAYIKDGISPNDVQTVVTYRTLFSLLDWAQPPRLLERNELRGFFWNLFTPGVDTQRELFAEPRSDGIESPPDSAAISLPEKFDFEGVGEGGHYPWEDGASVQKSQCEGGSACAVSDITPVKTECVSAEAPLHSQDHEDAALDGVVNDLVGIVPNTENEQEEYELDLDEDEDSQTMLLSDLTTQHPEISETGSLPNRVPLFAFVARTHEKGPGTLGSVATLTPTRADLIRAVRLSSSGVRAFVVAKSNGIFVLSSTSAFALFQVFVKASLTAEDREIARCAPGVGPGEPARRFSAVIAEGLDDIYTKIETYINAKQGLYIHGDVGAISHSHRTEIMFCKLVNLITARDVISAAGKRDNYARHYFARAGLAFDRAVYNTDVSTGACPGTFDMPVARASFFTWRQARANGGIWI